MTVNCNCCMLRQHQSLSPISFKTDSTFRVIRVKKVIYGRFGHCFFLFKFTFLHLHNRFYEICVSFYQNIMYFNLIFQTDIAHCIQFEVPFIKLIRFSFLEWKNSFPSINIRFVQLQKYTGFLGWMGIVSSYPLLYCYRTWWLYEVKFTEKYLAKKDKWRSFQQFQLLFSSTLGIFWMSFPSTSTSIIWTRHSM